MSEASGEGLAALGGPTLACQLLVNILRHAMSQGDENGRGADVELAELAVRGLSRAALGDRRQALLDAKGVKALIEVIRADNNALEAVEAQRRVGDGRLNWHLGCFLSLTFGISVTLLVIPHPPI